MSFRPNYDDLKKVHVKKRLWAGTKVTGAVLRDGLTAATTIMAVGLVHTGTPAFSADPLLCASISYGLNILGAFQSNKKAARMSDAQAKLHKTEIQKLNREIAAIKALAHHIDTNGETPLSETTLSKTLFLPEELLLQQKDPIRYQILKAQTDILATEALELSPKTAKRVFLSLKMPLGRTLPAEEASKQDLIQIYRARRDFHACYETGTFKDLLDKDTFALSPHAAKFSNKQTARHWHVALLAAPLMIATSAALHISPEQIASNSLLMIAAANALSLGVRLLGTIQRRNCTLPQKPSKSNFFIKLQKATSKLGKIHNDLAFAEIQKKLTQKRQELQRKRQQSTIAPQNSL